MCKNCTKIIIFCRKHKKKHLRLSGKDLLPMTVTMLSQSCLTGHHNVKFEFESMFQSPLKLTAERPDFEYWKANF